MYTLLIIQLLISLLVFPNAALSDRPPGKDAILLSRVRSLTLRGNRLTTSRRVSPIPQLKCTGPSKRICNMYEIDTMRCTNEGYDYDEEDVQWTCTASLPREFKLGATDVICEGYRNADDKWILKGSCGVEYRLLLTEAGEEKFGHLRNERSSSSNDELGPGGKVIFFGFMIAVFVFILAAFFNECYPGFGRVRWVVGRLVMRWEEEALGIGLVRHLHGAGPPRPEDMMTLGRVAQDRALRASPAPPQVPGLAQHAAGNSYKGAETRNGSRCLGEYAVAISL
ncbi:hypothetical protein CAN33_0012190 [Aspergillus niger]|uniref:Store-operated calcium entry-associated regulatory factor n=1 Tax=Aspergillus niger TaxID=5061 RepID=A0A505HPJ0_ASPNG|nr:hypothetical protein CAN33_0012190 [Aspergillus niger]